MAAITIVGRSQAHTALSPKMLNPAEDAHLKSMSTFKADEHLQLTSSKSAERVKKTARSYGIMVHYR
jgi:hypothetical protein